MFSSLTEHVELTFKVSTFHFIPLSLKDRSGVGGWGGGLMQFDKYSRDSCVSQVTAFILRLNHYQK